MIALRERVSVTGNGETAPPEARMVVTMTDGSIFESHIVNCRGSYERPLNNAELHQKFLVQAAPVLGDRNATELLARCWGIENTDDVQSIIAASAVPR